MSALPRLDPARRTPPAAALCAYAIGFGLSYLLVRQSLLLQCDGDDCLFTSGGWKFLFVMPLVPAALALFGTRRLLNGPRVEREELVLFLNAPGPTATVRDLLAPLEALGYALRAFSLNEALVPIASDPRAQKLVGERLLIQEATSNARLAYLRLVLPPPGSKGTGLLEFADTSKGIYAELAQFVLRQLSSIFPDLRYRRLLSALPPDPAAAVVVPSRPARLATPT